MKRIAIVAAAMLWAAPGAAADSPAMKAVKAACAEKWPGDYRMQAYCIDRQSEAGIAANRFVAEHPEGSEAREIFYRCGAKWKTGPGKHGYDWRMVMYCTERQMEAYRRLSR